MVLFEKVRDSIESMESMDENERLNLEKVITEPFTPPRDFRTVKIPMMVLSSTHGDSKVASASANIDQQRHFDSENLMELVVFNLREQKVCLTVRTWRQIVELYERGNPAKFVNRCVDQIPLETLFVLTKLDVDEVYERRIDKRTTRNEAFEKFIECFLFFRLSSNPRYAVQLAEYRLVSKVKEFLTLPSVVSALGYCLNGVISDGEDEPVSKLPKLEVDASWITSMIDKMNIYVAGWYSPFKGVALLDGILLGIGAESMVPEEDNSACHDAALYTISCHETVHFLIRAFTNDFNFSTPSKSVDGVGTRIRKEMGNDGKGLELGRWVEMVMFDGIQPEWYHIGAYRAATKFIERAKVQQICPPALIAAEEHATLGLTARLPSLSFPADLLEPQMFVD